MKQCFYILGGNIYFGMIPEEQVSGKMKLSENCLQSLKTDKKFINGDIAFSLWDNYAATEQELLELPDCCNRLLLAGNQNTGEGVFDVASLEERLRVTLPQEVKILYQVLAKTNIYENGFTDGKERFLQPEELLADILLGAVNQEIAEEMMQIDLKKINSEIIWEEKES